MQHPGSDKASTDNHSPILIYVTKIGTNEDSIVKMPRLTSSQTKKNPKTVERASNNSEGASRNSG